MSSLIVFTTLVSSVLSGSSSYMSTKISQVLNILCHYFHSTCLQVPQSTFSINYFYCRNWVNTPSKKKLIYTANHKLIAINERSDLYFYKHLKGCSPSMYYLRGYLGGSIKVFTNQRHVVRNTSQL